MRVEEGKSQDTVCEAACYGKMAGTGSEGVQQAVLIYDFDWTLAAQDVLDDFFLPSLGLEAGAFWQQSVAYARAQRMDIALSFMHLLAQHTRQMGRPLTQEMLRAAGRQAPLFPGLPGWFERMNAFGASLGLQLQHHVISGGMWEIIEGSAVARHMTSVFACAYLYNEKGEALWPADAITNSGKLRCLDRIRQGRLALWQDEGIAGIPWQVEAVPFHRMLFIGDGATDAPVMAALRARGGHSLAVYTHRERALPLLQQGFVEDILPADYVENSPLEQAVQQRLQAFAQLTGGTP